MDSMRKAHSTADTEPLRLTILEGDIEDAITAGFEGAGYYLDLGNGKIEMLIDPMYGDEDDRSIALRKRLKKKNPNLLAILPMRSHDAFQFMEDFVEDEVPPEAQGVLREMLLRRRPFRQFKDALFDFPDIRERWFKYQRERTILYAVAWLADQGVEAELIPGYTMP